MALNLLCWPRETLPYDLAREVLRGGADAAALAGCHVAGGTSSTPSRSTAWPSPASPIRRPHAQRRRPRRVPLSLTKPLGLGVLNNRHKATGEVFPQAVTVMTRLNAAASEAALRAGVRRCATDVTGSWPPRPPVQTGQGLGMSAVLDSRKVPLLDGAREAVRDGFVPGGSRRNLDWGARPTWPAQPTRRRCCCWPTRRPPGAADRREVPGAPVIGELVPRGSSRL